MLARASFLGWPSTRRPGYNPFSVIGPALFSTVATGSGLINLVTGQPGIASTNAPTSIIDGVIGPCRVSNSTFTWDTNFSPSQANDANNWTGAAIIRGVNLPGGLGFWTVTDLTGAAGVDFGNNGSSLIININGRSSVNSLLNIGGGDPFFVMASISFGSCAFLAMDLMTGNTQVATPSAGSFSGIGTAASVAAVGGINAGSGFSPGCNIAATMNALTFVTAQQMIDIAADPWQLWYPK